MENDDKKILIDIGCGQNTAPGHIGLDNRMTGQVDIIAELPDLPFKKDSVDGFRVRHVLEHFFSEDVFHILRRLSDCLKIGGDIHITVPHYSSGIAYHLDHKSFWSINTPHTLEIDGQHDIRVGSHYRLISYQLFWMRKEYQGRFPWLVRLMNFFINRSPFTMERLAPLYGGIYEMEFVLRKVK